MLMRNRVLEAFLKDGNRHARKYKTPKLYHDQIYQISIQYAKKHNLPIPTEVSEIGTEAIIFNTENQNVLMRAEQARKTSDTCEYILDELQDTGGVVKIFHIKDVSVPVYDDKRFRYVLTWKEKLDLDVKEHLRNIYGEKDLKHIEVAFYYLEGEDNVELLEHYPETKGLALAVKRGLPTTDIHINLNVGVTSDGRVVAFDC